MLIVWGFFAYKSLPNLLFGVLCLPGDQSHPFAQPTINPLACCICWAGLLGRAVFPPWNEGLNSGSYKWWRIHPPMQETKFQSLIWDDPTCHRATKRLSHNYWPVLSSPRATATEPMCCNCWSLRALEPVLCNQRSQCNGKPTDRNLRKAQASVKLAQPKILKNNNS